MGDSQCPEGGAGGGPPLGGRRSSSPPADCHHLVDSSNPPSAGEACGELNHVGWLAEHIGRLCLQPDYSDVTLVVEDVRLPAHRLVLASCSSYFRALLYGGMREAKQQEVVLQDTPLRAFELLLRYIYTGQLRLAGLQECVVLEVLELSHQYGFSELECGVSGYLERVLGVRNVCRIYDRACLYQLAPLARACRRFADRHAPAVLLSDAFLSLSPCVLEEMIGRDSFFAPEVDIFRAVCTWASHNPAVDPKPILKRVRLPLLTVPELLNVVRPTGLVCPNALLDAIKLRTETRDADRPYRGCLLPGENVATQLHGAQVLQGEMRAALLDGDAQGYDMERGFTRHPIDEGAAGIVVRLGAPCIANHLRLLLWDRDSRAYSYYVEVSVDQRDWLRVVDHSRFLCRSWQRLYFPARVIQYIHIVGTHNTVNRVFHAVSLECRHVGGGEEGAEGEEAFPELEEGLVVPRVNVATVARSAYVVEGVSRSRNALINGDTSKYDWDSGYTCHQLGNGAIVVQLAQPYRVDSMRQQRRQFSSKLLTDKGDIRGNGQSSGSCCGTATPGSTATTWRCLWTSRTGTWWPTSATSSAGPGSCCVSPGSRWCLCASWAPTTLQMRCSTACTLSARRSAWRMCQSAPLLRPRLLPSRAAPPTAAARHPATTATPRRRSSRGPERPGLRPRFGRPFSQLPSSWACLALRRVPSLPHDPWGSYTVPVCIPVLCRGLARSSRLGSRACLKLTGDFPGLVQGLHVLQSLCEEEEEKKTNTTLLLLRSATGNRKSPSEVKLEFWGGGGVCISCARTKCVSLEINA